MFVPKQASLYDTHAHANANFGPVVQKLQAFKDTRIEQEKQEKIYFRKTRSPHKI